MSEYAEKGQKISTLWIIKDIFKWFKNKTKWNNWINLLLLKNVFKFSREYYAEEIVENYFEHVPDLIDTFLVD